MSFLVFDPQTDHARSFSLSPAWSRLRVQDPVWNCLILLERLFCVTCLFSSLACNLFVQSKTPWVDSACADCPGFLVLGAAPGPGFRLRLGASDSSPALAFCLMAPWATAWICCLQLPYHTCKNGTQAQVFTAQGGGHADLCVFKGGQACTFRICTSFFVTSLDCLTLLGARDCPL